METKTIQVRVSAAAARAYEQASEAERCKLGALLDVRLTAPERPKRALEDLMDDASDQAQRNGLTPEILDDLLREARA